MRFLRLTLEAPVARLAEVAQFYEGDLALPLAGRLAFQIGETDLELRPSRGEPFYHFALLVPGDRFAAALEWANARTTLLPDPNAVFDFDFWDAQACYFLDPAGNIVELIAHRSIAPSGRTGPFGPAELVGVSEVGLVGDPPALAATLRERLGLDVWSGTVDEPGQLAFVGEQARTFILAPSGRGWLPTGRPSEPHAVEAVIEGRVDAEVSVDGSPHRVISRAR
jgi:catechol 2,3-dioxygenase-like lactoylglutathione lyase family enzyme